ncbi:MAG: dephospho-CoA kinase [Bacteroidales bacterium]|nr:dephospho-CoA kinase [Bacteroidales bacterium]
MIKVGLTGGIGSGKTTVANMFRILGVDIYSADSEAKVLMENNKELKTSIISLLGEESYLNQSLNSAFIASRVFNNPGLLEKLNLLVHPVVREDFADWIEERKSAPYIIQESAILFESGFSSFFNYTILVTADIDTRIDRVAKRDKMKRSAIIARIEQQMSDEEKLKYADFQLNNSVNKLLIPQVLELHNKFVSLHRKKNINGKI